MLDPFPHERSFSSCGTSALPVRRAKDGGATEHMAVAFKDHPAR